MKEEIECERRWRDGRKERSVGGGGVRGEGIGGGRRKSRETEGKIEVEKGGEGIGGRRGRKSRETEGRIADEKEEVEKKEEEEGELEAEGEGERGGGGGRGGDIRRRIYFVEAEMGVSE
ncbi:hypothetical protein Pcinc_033421 [Petrolisthes cinctipes]|uniref:Uncharacterized protein n=1 Tax=Petrolisthes cinctipes TaxID=88211 RepID=A0AAE1ES61_PETCI|nr:hypothetical protein Pcinc_033421 [Petrolisthes cinctipes]